MFRQSASIVWIWTGALLLVAVSLARAQAPAKTASPLPHSARLERFQASETVQRRFSTDHTLTNQAWVVKIEVIPHIDAENAALLIQEGLMNLEALYAHALSPYPGDISKRIVPDARFRPEFVRTNLNGLTFQYYLVHANARLGYGAVTPDVVKHRALIGWLYCPGREILYKARLFAPLNTPRAELESFFHSFQCPTKTKARRLKTEPKFRPEGPEQPSSGHRPGFRPTNHVPG